MYELKNYEMPSDSNDLDQISDRIFELVDINNDGELENQVAFDS